MANRRRIMHAEVSALPVRRVGGDIPVDHQELSPQRRAVMRKNVVGVYRAADTSVRREGHEWYPEAHRLAGRLAGRGQEAQGAGVLAALSPQRNWASNVAMAEELYRTPLSTIEGLRKADAQGRAARGRFREEHIPTGSNPLAMQTTDNILKAADIRLGADPESILPMRIKTGNFYRNILDPDDPEAVTIDAHAHDVAVGRKLGAESWVPDDRAATNRGLTAVGRYDTFAGIYRDAADEVGVLPQQMQATAWTRWPKKGS